MLKPACSIGCTSLNVEIGRPVTAKHELLCASCIYATPITCDHGFGQALSACTHERPTYLLVLLQGCGAIADVVDFKFLVTKSRVQFPCVRQQRRNERPWVTQDGSNDSAHVRCAWVWCARAIYARRSTGLPVLYLYARRSTGLRAISIRVQDDRHDEKWPNISGLPTRHRIFKVVSFYGVWGPDWVLFACVCVCG